MATFFDEYLIPEYTCKKCGHHTRSPLDDGGYNMCPDCGADLPSSRISHRPMYVTVAAYTRSMSYGGPEEGGWYYETFDIIDGTQRSFLDEDEPQALVYWQTLMARSEKDDSYVIATPNNDAHRHLPLKRPYYS